MKKNLLCAAALAAGFMFSHQEAKAQGFSIGPRVGMNFSTWAFSDGDKDLIKAIDEDKTMLMGTNFGVAANIGVNKMFSIQPELNFSQKGLKLKHGSDESSITSNYLEIPVLARVTFGSEKVKFFANAGPYAAFMMSGKTKYKSGGEEESKDIEFDYQEQDPGFPNDNRNKPNRLDFGLAMGAGVGMKAGPGTINLEARYGLGLSDMTTYEKERPKGAIQSSNRNIGLAISYMYPLGH